MATYETATSKQNGYYKALTGQWLPKGTSKFRASQLIDKAKNGHGPVKKADRIEVQGQEIFNAWGRQGVKFVVERNYAPDLGPFATFAEAEAAARAKYPTADLILSPDSVRTVCVD